MENKKTEIGSKAIVKGMPKPKIDSVEYYHPKNKKTGEIDEKVTICELYHDIEHLYPLIVSKEAYDLILSIPNPIKTTSVMKDGDEFDEKKSQDIARAKAKRKLYERISIAFRHDINYLTNALKTNKNMLSMCIEKYTHENDYFNLLTLNEEYTDVE